LTQRSDGEWCLDHALPILIGRNLAHRERMFITNIVSELPVGAAISDIGVAFGREPAVLRINVASVGFSDLLPYLGRIGWPGTAMERDRIHSLVTRLSSLVTGVKLCIDLADGVGARVGLEFSLPVQQATRTGWTPLLNFLVERGLARPELAAAVLSYVGTSSPGANPTRWPPTLLAAARLLGQRYTSVMVRNISHFKVAFSTEGEEAKAYLVAGYAWRRNAASKCGPKAR
jgi:hypothetical protein